MSCTNQQNNAKSCTCTYDCERKGNCCACIRFHRDKNQLPGCYFDKENEKTYDRSIDRFLKQIGKK